MKRIFVAIFSVVLFFSNLGTSIACEFLKEQIGVVVPNIIEKYDLLDDPTNEDSGSTTYFKEYDSLSLCDDPELEDTSLRVFIREQKLIATELEGVRGEADKGRILVLAKNTLGYSTEEEIDERWIGGIRMKSFGDEVIYGRVEHPDGNYETLIITKPEFRQYMSGPDVREFR